MKTKVKLMVGLMLVQTLLLVAAFLGQWQLVRSVAQSQLQQQAEISADSLALTMGTAAQAQDLQTLGIYADALFNRGGYQHIRLVLRDGLIAVNRESSFDKELPWPLWFEDLFPVSPGRGYAELLSGWHLIGHIDVETSRTQVMASYWKTFKELLAWYGILLLTGFTGLVWIIHRKQSQIA